MFYLPPKSKVKIGLRYMSTWSDPRDIYGEVKAKGKKSDKKVKDLCPKTFEQALIDLKRHVTKNKIKMSTPIKFVICNNGRFG